MHNMFIMHELSPLMKSWPRTSSGVMMPSTSSVSLGWGRWPGVWVWWSGPRCHLQCSNSAWDLGWRCSSCRTSGCSGSLGGRGTRSSLQAKGQMKIHLLFIVVWWLGCSKVLPEFEADAAVAEVVDLEGLRDGGGPKSVRLKYPELLTLCDMWRCCCCCCWGCWGPATLPVEPLELAVDPLQLLSRQV